MDTRKQLLQLWLKEKLNVKTIDLVPLAGDASFRRYFRLKNRQKSYIAMDAPPDKEPCAPYIKIDKALEKANLTVPHIIAQNIEEGFLLLSDLGNKLLVQEASHDNANKLYSLTIQKLLQMQKKVDIQSLHLESFIHQRLPLELAYHTEWFLQKFLEITLTQKQQSLLKKVYELLLTNANAQPTTFIHLDYHSRNLMVLPHDIGILDFQDAMIGPITYDLVSLIRDCYLSWPVVQVNHWALNYRKAAIENRLLSHEVSDALFLRWFDLMGMQRHLKASFIFARKFLRDDNKDYLKDIPRTLNYVMNVCERTPELKEYHRFLQKIVMPKLQEKLQELMP